MHLTFEFSLQLRISFLLGEMLKVMIGLTRSLYSVERLAHQRLLETDLTPLRKLAISLPVFPYWTSLQNRTAENWEAVIQAERPVLGDALLALRAIASEDANQIANRRLFEDGKSQAWKTAIGAAVAMILGTVGILVGWLMRR